MSETMVERVARATRDAVTKDRGRSVPFGEMSLFVARAAIEAMREPTPDVFYAVRRECGADARSAWYAGIDAALAEKPE